LRRDAFDRLAPAIQRRLLGRALAFIGGGPQDIEETHIESMATLIDGPAGKSLDLPGRVRFSVGYESATLHSLEGDTRSLPSLDGRHPLNIPGDTDLPGWRVTARSVDGDRLVSRPRESPDLQPRDRHTAMLSYSRLGGPLFVRSRVQGDRFQPLGMKAAKKLQDFMVDSKVPRECRDRVPLVVSDRGIAWVVGWRIADWGKVQSGDTRVLELTFWPTQ